MPEGATVQWVQKPAFGQNTSTVEVTFASGDTEIFEIPTKVSTAQTKRTEVDKKVDTGSHLRSLGNSWAASSGSYGSGTMKTPYITAGGSVAWCIDPSKEFPKGLNYRQEIYNDPIIQDILYYAQEWGWDKPGNMYTKVYGGAQSLFKT